MGKRRIEQLLAQLEANQQRQIEIDATIFTVAQVAVNKLQAKVEQQLRQLEG